MTYRLWMPGRDRHEHAVVNIRFAAADCKACPARSKCTHAATMPRMLTVRPRELHATLQAARQRQTTEAFQAGYATRAGVEGTISQSVRVGDLRRSRYIGLVKTHLHHLLTATAINLLRVGAWLVNTRLAQTHTSPFAALA